MIEETVVDAQDRVLWRSMDRQVGREAIETANVVRVVVDRSIHGILADSEEDLLVPAGELFGESIQRKKLSLPKCRLAAGSPTRLPTPSSATSIGWSGSDLTVSHPQSHTFTYNARRVSGKQRGSTTNSSPFRTFLVKDYLHHL